MKQYYEDYRISQSYLKKFLNSNPRSLHRKAMDDDYYYHKEKIYFSKGKLLDLLLVGEEIDEYFYIEDDSYVHPSDAVESIAQQVIDEQADTKRTLEIIAQHKYRSNYKESTMLKWIDDTLLPIINHKKEIGDRVVLTQEEFMQIATMENAIREGPYTKSIMEQMPGEYQVALYHDNFKVLIDYLQLDHKQRIGRIIDFKTTGEYLERFPSQILKYRLDIQLSFYTEVARANYPGYTFYDPILIVGSKKEPEYAEPFTLSVKVLENARYGFTDLRGNYREGWQELLERADDYNQELYNRELIKTGTNYINEL